MIRFPLIERLLPTRGLALFRQTDAQSSTMVHEESMAPGFTDADAQQNAALIY